MTDWKTRTRIFAGFGAAGIGIMMTPGALACARLRTIEGTAARITGDTMPRIYPIGQVQSLTLPTYTLLADADGQLDRCCRLLPRAIDEFGRFRDTVERAGWYRPK
jgi:hypothetical protein